MKKFLLGLVVIGLLMSPFATVAQAEYKEWTLMSGRYTNTAVNDQYLPNYVTGSWYDTTSGFGRKIPAGQVSTYSQSAMWDWFVWIGELTDLSGGTGRVTVVLEDSPDKRYWREMARCQHITASSATYTLGAAGCTTTLASQYYTLPAISRYVRSRIINADSTDAVGIEIKFYMRD